MIKANELRVGNWLYSKTLNKCERVYKASDIDWIAELGDSVTGIPLTPEILEKAGFKKTLTPFYEIDLGNNIGQIAVNPDNGMVWLKHHRTGNVMNPMTDNRYYLHQLQNLFFALTGEEIEIKL